MIFDHSTYFHIFFEDCVHFAAEMFWMICHCDIFHELIRVDKFVIMFLALNLFLVQSIL